MAKIKEEVEKLKEKADELGGFERIKIIAILAFVLALDTADKATISVVAKSLKTYFHINNTDIGFLIALVAFTGSIFCLPFGILVDRMNRKNLLMIAISFWTLATIISGTATSFTYLVIVRFFLAGVTGMAGPTIASLIGDFFPVHQRARIYGLILSGELIGAAFGFFISAEINYALNWRWPFFIMAIPSILLIFIIWRYLPEPARGGKSWMSFDDKGADKAAKAQKIILKEGNKPRENLIIKEDPVKKSLWWAVKYVVRIPTFMLLIIGSSLIYFFFSGIRAFIMIYLPEHYHIAASSLTPLLIIPGIFGIVGLVSAGGLTEWFFKRRLFTARIIVPAVSLFLCVIFFAIGLTTTSVVLGIIMLSFAILFTAGANPPIDAARLDIMHPRLWGRAEAIRTALKSFCEGGAPLLFGVVSTQLGGHDQGLFWTYLIMLIPLFCACLLAIPASRTYKRDVATAAASVLSTSKLKIS